MGAGPSFRVPTFGTDGLRGPAGTPPMDRETMVRVGAALGLWLQRQGPEHKKVLLGHDGRVSAPWIAECLARGLQAAEVGTASAGLLTTPALSWLTREDPYVAGIMISASHNHATDNGIKIFDSRGRKLPDDAEAEIAETTAVAAPVDDRLPRLPERHGLIDRYIESLGNSFPDLDLSGVRIAVDAANGGAAELAPRVLSAFGAEDPVTVGCAPDGLNINDGCGSLHPELLAGLVRESGAFLGICLDGDGDRCIFIDELGGVRDGDDILALFGPAMAAGNQLPRDTVVTTVMSNLGLHRTLSKAGLKVVTTPVGDRHVARAMEEGGYALGGEQSGHILFSRPEGLVGDGLYTALQLLSLAGFLQQPPSVSFADFVRYPQHLINVPVASQPDLDSVAEIRETASAVRELLGDNGRVVLRYSGTEPLCRVMVEGPEQGTVEEQAERIAAAIRSALAP